jgi:hypothetical protein
VYPQVRDGNHRGRENGTGYALEYQRSDPAALRLRFIATLEARDWDAWAGLGGRP